MRAITNSIWPLLIILLASTAVLLSASVNWRFGYHHLGGTDTVQAATIAALLVTADLLKAALPVHITQRRLVGRWPIAFIGMFIVLVACSAWASWEVNSQGRAAGLGEARAAKAKLDRLKSDQARLAAQLTKLGAPIPAAALRSRQKALEYDRRWTSSKECTDATATRSRAFCAEHSRLFSQIAAATRAEQVRAELSQLSDQIRAQTNSTTETPPAAAAQLVAGLLSWPLDRVLGLQAAILAIVLELASAALPGLAYWSLMHARQSDRKAHGDGSVQLPEPVGRPDPKPVKKRARKSTRPSSITDQFERLASSTNVTPIRPRKSGLTEQLGRSVLGPATEQFSSTRLSSSEGTQLLSSNGSAALAIHAAEPLGLTAQEDLVAAFAAEQLVEVQAGAAPATELLNAINTWCAECGLEPTNKTRLGLDMVRLGHRKRRTGANGNTLYVGIRLRELPC